jgi:hypothetical protein
MKERVLLLISNSYDTTADLLVFRLGADKVFRFNYDIWNDYGFEITANGFSLADPSGRKIASEDVAKVLWRKPWSRRAYRPASRTSEDRYYDGEMLYALRELVNLSWLDGKVVLVEPFAEIHAGKFVQMRTASSYFQVPHYQFRRKAQSIFPADEETVVKSLTMEPVGDEDERELLFTTKVVDSSISAECPWMVQRYVRAQKDVTVAFVYDRLFAFELDRKGFVDQVTDWRELPSDWERSDWRPHQLPDTVASGVFGFMKEMGLHFGRLDFLWGTDGYFFLEVNTNGEWAWLDTEGRYGLLQKVVEEISPDTALHSIPFLRFNAAD